MNANKREELKTSRRIVQDPGLSLAGTDSQKISEAELIYKQEVFRIVGCAMEVLNELGHGLHEKPYENALVVEFGLQGIPVVQQRSFDVLYKQVKVSEYVPDLIAFGKVVVDTKVIDQISDHERGQMINYLRISKLPVGVILNFQRAKLQWERVVVSNSSRSLASIRGFSL